MSIFDGSIFKNIGQLIPQSWQSGVVNDVLRNAEHPRDDAERYFIFKALLMSPPEVQKAATFRDYEQGSGTVGRATHFVCLKVPYIAHVTNVLAVHETDPY